MPTVNELKEELREKGLKVSGTKKELEERLEEYKKIDNKVVDKALYMKAREKVKKRVKVWPSAYASGQVVSEYKRMGGKYKGEKGGTLDRWYKEKWVDVSRPKGKGYHPCGREESNVRKYPYCRPTVRVNSKTPKTVSEIGKKKLEKLVEKKRKMGLPKKGKPRRITLE